MLFQVLWKLIKFEINLDRDHNAKFDVFYLPEIKFIGFLQAKHCVKSIRVWGFSGLNVIKCKPAKLRIRTLFMNEVAPHLSHS